MEANRLCTLLEQAINNKNFSQAAHIIRMLKERGIKVSISPKLN